MCVWRMVFQLKECQPPPSAPLPGTAPAGAKQAERLERDFFLYQELGSFKPEQVACGS